MTLNIKDNLNLNEEVKLKENLKTNDLTNKEKLISLKNVSMIYKTSSKKATALEDINLDIDEGEFVCLLGPSGCGKSTLLKLMAGFIMPTEGKITVNGKEIRGANWHRGVVFQQPSLYPWLNVEDNVKFGLKMRKIPKKEGNEIALHFLEKVGLLEFRKHKPYELSGGMRQRISIARVLVNSPLVMLMDEPFGALDALTREQMQTLIRNIWWETKKTILFITHDVDEALSLGSRVIVMSSGPGRIIKEFKTNFTKEITSDNGNDVRFKSQYKELREQILDLINNVHSEYRV